ncbi:MAG: hypothetical protein IK065_02730 [Neisseriaceae bacterium]|nr:hypothetical protein [Neisseriaceae bacterium]
MNDTQQEVIDMIDGKFIYSQDAKRMRQYLYIIYILFLCGLITGGITTLPGIIMAYIMRNDAMDSIFEDHVDYLISTFWASLLIGIIGLVLMVILIGWLVLVGLSIWFLYRCILGLMRLNENRSPK